MEQQDINHIHLLQNLDGGLHKIEMNLTKVATESFKNQGVFTWLEMEILAGEMVTLTNGRTLVKAEVNDEKFHKIKEGLFIVWCNYNPN